jgi:hypothetical protein
MRVKDIGSGRPLSATTASITRLADHLVGEGIERVTQLLTRSGRNDRAASVRPSTGRRWTSRSERTGPPSAWPGTSPPCCRR